MTFRRWTDKPNLEPGAVRGLREGHPALVENRTLFPSTVVEVTADAPERLLVSGRNSRKLGHAVAKGSLAGYALYGLTLEERATCPLTCEVRDVCYGNGMQFARRHRIGDPAVFLARLEAELAQLMLQHPDGVLVRLHVLGDFPSVDYVAFWAGMLDAHPRLACYGYTHRTRRDGIGLAISAVKALYPARFRIRWSSTEPVPDGALVVNEVPAASRTAEGLVCPAQTDATACCASCGLCWEEAVRGTSILFIRHGRKDPYAAANAGLARADAPAFVPGKRPVAPIVMPSNQKPGPVPGGLPAFRTVSPTSLLVEETYQRDLSGRSHRLIRRIVTGWDWAKFKPPVCAETPDGLFVIDGQHTAIAAATHPDIEEIPVIVIDAPQASVRAGAFVAHNRDRVTMSELQIFTAEVAAGSPEAQSVQAAVQAGGGRLPRNAPQRGKERPGDVVAVTAARRAHAAHGPAHLERIVRIATLSGVAPVSSTVVYGLHALLTDPAFAEAAARPDGDIAAALAGLGEVNAVSQRHASVERVNRYRACALLVARGTMPPAGADGRAEPPAAPAPDPRESPPSPAPSAQPQRREARWSRWAKPHVGTRAGAGAASQRTRRPR